MSMDRPAERGSIIVWIFIAIAVFAALSFVAADMMRGGNPGTLTETSRLKAAAVMQYAGAVQRGIRTMRISGVDESELCFHAAQWGHNDYQFGACSTVDNNIFNPAGGGISFQDGAADWYGDTAPAADGSTWIFSSRYEVINVGTNDAATDGATDTDADSTDLIMATAPIRDDVCLALNILLDYDPATPPAVAATTYDNLAADEFVGTFSDGAGFIGDLGRERCVADPAGYNIYYKVILAR